MLDHLLGGHLDAVIRAARPVDDHDQPPGPGEPGLVAGLGQHIDRRLGFDDRRVAALELGKAEMQGAGCDPHAGDETRVLESLGRRRSIGHDFAGFLEPAFFHQRVDELRQQLDPQGVVGLEEGRGAAEQVARGRRVATPEGPPAGRRELGRGARRDRPTLVVERPELRAIANGLLEVIAEDFLELGLAAAVPVDRFGPRDEPFVEGRPRPLEQALVGRVADEDVMEAERGVVRLVGQRMHELLAVEGG